MASVTSKAVLKKKLGWIKIKESSTFIYTVLKPTYLYTILRQKFHFNPCRQAEPLSSMRQRGFRTMDERAKRNPHLWSGSRAQEGSLERQLRAGDACQERLQSSGNPCHRVFNRAYRGIQRCPDGSELLQGMNWAPWCTVWWAMKTYYYNHRSV